MHKKPWDITEGKKDPLRSFGKDQHGLPSYNRLAKVLQNQTKAFYSENECCALMKQLKFPQNK